ncbi:MAG: restriction endonuclease subunit S [Bacteroidales bacterium]|nr:restriction endonuclease subunit S [Bacteroidales bacterium]
MNEWKEYTFSEFIQINPSVKLPKDKAVSFVEMKDLVDGRRFCIPSSERRNGSGSKFHEYDTLFARITPCLENGKISQVKGLKGGIGLGSTEFLVFRGTPTLSDNNFVFYLSRWEEVRAHAEINLDGTSGRQRVPKECFNDLKLNLPTDLAEQRAIASILSSLDEKIDLLHRQNATLEKMAETLFRHWFVEEAKEEWDEINFGEFVTPKKGKNITKSEVVEGSYPVVAGGLEPSCYHIEANTKSPVITISASGANAGYIRLYTTPVWSSDSSYIDESITPYVYFCYVFLKINQSKLTDKQEGSAQPHIYPSHIMELDFMSYPESIIKVFEESARPLFNKIKSNQTQIRTLTALRDTLLPKLMSGEVRVEPD